MDEGINSMVETIKELEAENEKLKLRLSNVSGELEAIRTDFCLWYYAQSQPLDAHKVVDWFASNFR